jgi:hypothetical protein
MKRLTRHSWMSHSMMMTRTITESEMKTALCLIAFASSAYAITPDEFVSPGPLDVCYVQRDSHGEEKQVISVRYARPYRTPLGYRRDVSGDMQPTYEPQSTYPLFGVASMYTLTTSGLPDIRLNLSMRIPPSATENVVYFNDWSAPAWERIDCGGPAARGHAPGLFRDIE